MLLVDILCESVDVGSPTFKTWFAGSKVVDRSGSPLLVYHGSFAWDAIEEFKPLTHFGSIKAANARLKHEIGRPGKGDTTAIYPVYLSIKSPMRIVDRRGVLHTTMNIANYLAFGSLYNGKYQTVERNKQFGKISIEEYDEVNMINNRTLSSNVTTQALIKVLRARGHDGLMYINQVEDRGSVSWTVFDHTQVWPLYADSPAERKGGL